jgi:pyrophosphatase PpaX
MPTENDLRAVLFDLDGTLLDTFSLILESFRFTMQKHRGTVPPEEPFLAQLGTPLARMLAAYSDDASEIEAMVATYRDHNARCHDDRVRAYPGTQSMVRNVADHGLARALVTSKSHPSARHGLELCGFDGLFPVVIGMEDVSRHKPDPEPVRVALERLRIQPAHALFVGDSPFDMEAGRLAGVKTAAVLWGPFAREDLVSNAPDFWLEHPSNLGPLLTG